VLTIGLAIIRQPFPIAASSTWYQAGYSSGLCISAKRTQLSDSPVNGKIYVNGCRRRDDRAGSGCLQSLKFVECPE
jgi:hypothetical protein